MDIDFKPFFAKYEALVDMVEGIFSKVTKEFPENVKCGMGCSDCCFAVFDVTLIEALYLNHQFNNKFDGVQKLDLIDKANRADRKIYKLKRLASKDFAEGANEVEILGRMATERVRCPLLNDKDQCDLYASRPLTCRLYGIPTASSGMSHTCGKSGFVEGEKYPTLNMDALYKQLYNLSAELVSAIKSKHAKMSEMLVPVSMAMITDYNEVYLGLPVEQTEEDEKKGE